MDRSPRRHRTDRIGSSAQKVLAISTRMATDPEPPAAAAPGSRSLREDVVSGLRWVAASYYLNIAVRLGISIALARLLTPEQFGVMALAMAIVGGLALVQESGFSSALVQYPGAAREAAGHVWVVSVLSATVLAAALVAAAPAVSGFFEHPELADVLRFLGLMLVLRSMGNASRALLQRGMRFRDSATIDVAATAVYGVIGVALAATGHGVWSLVLAQLAADVTTSALAFVRAPLPLARSVDFAVLRDLARFGRHMVAANVLGMLHLQLPSLVIGKMLGAGSLGLYEMGLRWAWMPVQGVTHVAGRVSYPAFARLRDRPEAVAAAYERAFQGICLLTLPAAVGLALVADPLIRTLYGNEWEGAIGPLRVLAFMGLFHALAATTGEVFKGIGRPGFITGFAVFYNAVLATMLYLLGMQAGLLGVAVATLLAPLLTALAGIVSLCRLVPVRGATFLRIGATAASAAAVMAVAVIVADASTRGFPPAVELAVSVVVGIVTYALVIRASEPDWFRELVAATGLARHQPAQNRSSAAAASAGRS